MTTNPPWTQTVGALVAAAALAATNLNANEQNNIFGWVSPTAVSNPNRIFADSATREIVLDTGIVLAVQEVARSSSRWYRYVTRRLAELSSGKFSRSGMPLPPNSACAHALQVAEGLFDANTPTPSVVPSESGTVLFVWRSGPLDLEIEVGPEETAVWAYDRPHGEVWSGQLEDRRANVSELLASFGPH